MINPLPQATFIYDRFTQFDICNVQIMKLLLGAGCV